MNGTNMCSNRNLYSVLILVSILFNQVQAKPSNNFSGISLGDSLEKVLQQHKGQIYKEKYIGFGARPGRKDDTAAYKSCGKGRIYVELEDGMVEYAVAKHQVYQWIFKKNYDPSWQMEMVADLFIRDYGSPRKTFYYDKSSKLTSSPQTAYRIVLIWDDLTSVSIIGEQMDERTRGQPFTYEIKRTDEESMRKWMRKSRECFLEKMVP